MLYKKTGERIRYQKTCENCPPHVATDDIVKGFQYEKGKYITITDKEIDAIKSAKDKSIEISQFVNLDEIDPIYFEKSYYVNPKGAEKAFKLILESLASENKVGIAKTVLGQKEQVVALRAMGGNMILYTMHFYDEIQKSPATTIEEKITNDELRLAKQIINNMTKPFDPKKYKDEYRERLSKAIEAKINGQSVKRASVTKTAKIINLMDALKATVATSGEASKKKVEPIKKSTPSKKVAS